MSIFDEAVSSVFRRGFYRDDNPANSWGLLQGQMLRLTEEVGEVARALRKRDMRGAALEVADVTIVCANLHAILQSYLPEDIDLEEEIRQKLAADEQRGYLHGGGTIPGGSGPNRVLAAGE